MTPNILLDNRGIKWSEFVDQLIRLQRMVQSEAAFAYILTEPRLRHETERLCRDLGLEDYAHVLLPGEHPPKEPCQPA
jgi:hypothetical protein